MTEPRFENDDLPDEIRAKIDEIAADLNEANPDKQTKVKVVSDPKEMVQMGLAMLTGAAGSYVTKDEFIKEVACAVANMVCEKEMDAARASAVICGVAIGQCLPLPLEDAREHGLTPRMFLTEGCLPGIHDDEAFFAFLEQRDVDMLERQFNLEGPVDDQPVCEL